MLVHCRPIQMVLEIMLRRLRPYVQQKCAGIIRKWSVKCSFMGGALVHIHLILLKQTPGTTGKNFYSVQHNLSSNSMAAVINDLFQKQTKKPLLEDFLEEGGLFQFKGLDILTIHGMGVYKNTSLSGVIDVISQGYGVDIYNNGDKTFFSVLPVEHVGEVRDDDIIPVIDHQGSRFTIHTERINDANIPNHVSLRYIGEDRNFSLEEQHASSVDLSHNRHLFLDLSLILDGSYAFKIASKMLSDFWNERDRYTFSLPISYLHLVPNDRISLEVSPGKFVKTKIIALHFKRRGLIKVEAVGCV